MPSSVRPTNTPRVTMLMQSNMLMNSIRGNTVDLLKVQNQLTTGLKIARPSESPALASSIMHLDSALEKQNQYLKNIDHAVRTLDASEGAITSAESAIRDAHTAVLEAINLGTKVSRDDAAITISGVIDQIIAAGNAQDQTTGYYIFGGHQGTEPPFVKYDDGVLFTGDLNSLNARISAGNTFDFMVSASDAFNLVDNYVPAAVDLNPAMTSDTLLSDLNGAMGQGIRLGSIAIADDTPDAAVVVDLSNCITVGDVISEIENCGLASVQNVAIESDINGTNLRIDSPGATLTVTEIGNGYTARDLGINGAGAGGALTGQDVDAHLTVATPIAALAPGVGIDTINGFTVTNSILGSQTITIDPAGTLGDVIREINNAGVGARAQINDAGTGIEVYNLLSGSEMTIGENGGTSAADLGIRSMTGNTPLADLNGGDGVHIEAGKFDLLITDSAGGTHNVNLDGSVTINDVITAINTAIPGGEVVASFATNGNGILLNDTTVPIPGGNLTVTSHDDNTTGYFVAQELGLQDPDNPNTGTTLAGADVNAVTVDSIFTNLFAIRDALGIVKKSDANAALTELGGEMEPLLDRTINMLGRVGVQVRTLQFNRDQMEDQFLATETLRSDIADIDFTEAITRYQNLYTAMQGNLMTGGQLNNTTLLDFLR